MLGFYDDDQVPVYFGSIVSSSRVKKVIWSTLVASRGPAVGQRTPLLMLAPFHKKYGGPSVGVTTASERKRVASATQALCYPPPVFDTAQRSPGTLVSLNTVFRSFGG